MTRNRWYIKAILIESVLIIVLSLMTYKLWEEKKNIQESLDDTFTVIPVEAPQEKREIVLEPEEIAQLAKECFLNYRTMYFKFFMSFPVSSDSEEATINGWEGYYLVENYGTLQEVKEQIETICTKEYTEKLCVWEWNLDTESPILVELDGRLYARLADAPYDSGTVEIPLAVLDESGCIVFVYNITHDEHSEWKEEGTVILKEKDGKWLVDSVTEWK